MALAYSILADVNALVTGSFTPANNSMLLVIGGAIGNSDSGMRGTNLDISNTGGWTKTVITRSTGSAGWSYGIGAWRLDVVTGAAMTVTLSSSVGSISIAPRLTVIQVTGHDTSSPIGAIATPVSVGASADGAQSATLSGSPAATSRVFGAACGAVNSGTVNITEGSGFTEDVDAPLLDQRRFQIQSKLALGSTTVPWVDVAVGGNIAGVGVELIAFEVKEASGSGTTLTVDSASLALEAQNVNFIATDALVLPVATAQLAVEAQDVPFQLSNPGTNAQLALEPQPINLLAQATLVVDMAQLALEGQAIALLFVDSLPITPVDLALEGQSIALLRSGLVVGGPGGGRAPCRVPVRPPVRPPLSRVVKAP